MANQSLRNSFFVAKITACLPRYSLTFAISAHDSPSFFLPVQVLQKTAVLRTLIMCAHFCAMELLLS